MVKLTLESDKLVYAVCRLHPSDTIPPWSIAGGFYSISKTSDELSIVCLQDQIPSSIKAEKDWRCLKVKGPLDFALTGILASLSGILAKAGISIFSISTFDTDYILVKDEKFGDAITCLKAAVNEVIINE